MRWTCFAAVGLLGCLVSGTLARADVFDPKQVPDDVKWVMHVDVDSLRDSKVWDIVEQALKTKPGAQQGIAMAEQITGGQFPRDLHDVTLYGREYGGDAATVIIHATVDKTQILSLLEQNAAFGSSKHGDYEVDTWVDEGKNKQMYGCFQTPSLVIIGNSQADVEAALDTIDGKSASLKADSSLAPRDPKGTAVVVAARSIPEMVKANKTKSPVVDKLDSACITFSVHDNTVSLNGTGMTAAPEDAERLHQLANGMKALIELSVSRDSTDAKTKILADALSNLAVKHDGKAITAEMSMAIETLQNLVELKLSPSATTSHAADNK